MPFSIDPIFYGAKFYTQTKTLDIAGVEIYMIKFLLCIENNASELIYLLHESNQLL